jgi:hypothetical protein
LLIYRRKGVFQCFVALSPFPCICLVVRIHIPIFRALQKAPIAQLTPIPKRYISKLLPCSIDPLEERGYKVRLDFNREYILLRDICRETYCVGGLG